MASLPQQPSQRSPTRSNTSQSDSPPTSQFTELQNDPSQSAATIDSQTVLIGTPTSSASSPKLAAQSAPDSEPRKCWICFSDETEDTPTTSAWKSPCPCALKAHEACLLDWVADMESPQNRNRQGQRIQCPQCKTDIQIARPRSLLVSSVAAVDRLAGKLTIPGVIAALGGSILCGAWFHGMASVYIVFGERDFLRLVQQQPGGRLGLKWAYGASIIPIALVASRTHLADGVLPLLPVLFFATKIPDVRSAPRSLWPPSAAMTFASLPYIRAIYNVAYRQLFYDKQLQWMRELQPQMAGNLDNNAAQEHNDHDEQDEGHFHEEHDIQLEIIHEDEPVGANHGGVHGHHEEVHRLWDQAVMQAGPVGPPEEDNQNQNNDPNNNQDQGGQDAEQANQAQPQQRRGGGDFVINTGRAADALMGALAFPAIAAAAGELLRISLPKALTSGPKAGRPGLLQSRWGRSVIGGCLFVVVKDTLVLYSRYRLAKGQRERKIVDWDARRDKTRTEGRGTQT